MVNLSSNNSNNVRVSAGGQRNINVNSPTDNNINANNNGNSQRARSWAIGEGLIDGEDYSAKYWAEQAKISEEIARESIDAENNAHIWAEGTDEEVEAIGGTHSSKGWVDYVIENAPTASVEETEQGAVLTVTDINGTTTATIYNGADGQDGAPGQDGRDGTNGADGQDGQDGFSPIATVSKSGNTATISITDANGTTTTTISDGTNGTNGTNGQDGQDGADGYSPTATVTKSGSVATITITDKNGTTTANVYDGTGGGGGSYSAGTGIDITNDTISIDTSVVAQLSDIPTNYVTTDTAQNISGRKTFLGEKAIYFKQSISTDKLGFTLFNSSDTELGAFEWRPSTISGGALLNINVPYSSSNYVGFRYWGTAVNIIAPKVATAGSYYIPVNITDGTNTVTANSNGTVNISSLLSSGGIQNTATGTDSLTILGTPASDGYAINIGVNSEVTGENGIALGNYALSVDGGIAIGQNATTDGAGISIGYQCDTVGFDSIAIGYGASSTESKAIQIGDGRNTTANSFQVATYQLLDTTTGLIPDARISTNIARTSQIPTAISDLTDDTATTPIDKAESVVDNNSGSLKFWSGTKAQYDAIVTKDRDTLYNITDDANPTLSILEMLYPVGSIYIGTMSVCPLQTLGIGTWQLVATDRVLQGAGTRGNVGDTINESLPNHKHVETFVFSEGLRALASVYGAQATGGNAKSIGQNITHTSNDRVDKALTWGADNATYQDNAPVQQDAYLVNIWERIS